MAANNGTIFNVPEAEGTDRVELETTAAAAQINAPTSSIAREVEENADHAKDAAHDAASAAQSKGPSLTGSAPSAVDQFQRQAKQTTNAAVAEGQHDVNAAKATTAGYVDQAKALASSVINTAQSYLPANAGGHPNANGTPTAQNATDIVSSLQSGATTALETTKGYLAAAQETAQPYIENAKPHIENAKGVAQGYLGTAGTQGQSTHGSTPASSTGIPATSAPLESGPHTVGTPYPSTTTTTGTSIGGNSVPSNVV